MARTVSDTALLLSAICDRSIAPHRDPMAFPLDTGSLGAVLPRDPATLRVAVTADLGGVLVSQSVRRAFEARVQRISRLVRACEWHPIDLRAAPTVDWHLRQDLFVGQYAAAASTWDANFNPNVRATYESALRTSMADIALARRTQMELYQAFAAIFDTFDLLICPGVSIAPFPWRDLNPLAIDGRAVENYMEWLQLTSSITVVGHPVAALPCGLDETGMPFGVQVIGAMFGDRELLNAAAGLERAFADDPIMVRPEPDFAALQATQSDCRTLGRTVQNRA